MEVIGRCASRMHSLTLLPLYPSIFDEKPSLIECPLLMASTAHLDVRLGREAAVALVHRKVGCGSRTERPGLRISSPDNLRNPHIS